MIVVHSVDARFSIGFGYMSQQMCKNYVVGWWKSWHVWETVLLVDLIKLLSFFFSRLTCVACSCCAGACWVLCTDDGSRRVALYNWARPEHTLSIDFVTNFFFYITSARKDIGQICRGMVLENLRCYLGAHRHIAFITASLNSVWGDKIIGQPIATLGQMCTLVFL